MSAKPTDLTVIPPDERPASIRSLSSMPPKQLVRLILSGPGEQHSWIEEIERALKNDPKLTSKYTQDGYLHNLRAFETWRGGRLFTKSLVEQYLVYLATASTDGAGGKKRRQPAEVATAPPPSQPLAPSTINRSLAAIKWWAKKLSDRVFESGMDAAARDEIIAQLSRIQTIGERKGGLSDDEMPGREILDEEFSALLGACLADPPPPAKDIDFDDPAAVAREERRVLAWTRAGRRDAAIFALAWATGLRIGEIVALERADLKKVSVPKRAREDGWAAEGYCVCIRHGKGDKAGNVPVAPTTLPYLNGWLRERGNDAGPLFCPVLKNGRILAERPISEQALAKILHKRVAGAAIAPITFHDFRRTRASQLMDTGTDMRTVQRVLRHSNLSTTGRYDRRSEAVVWQALGAVELPRPERQ